MNSRNQAATSGAISNSEYPLDPLLHLFPNPPSADSVPTQIPSPFSTTPHQLAIQAAEMLQQQLLATTQEWSRDFSVQGKMFGVLVVSDQVGRIGYLASFSGMVGHGWHQPGYVPQLFDLEAHDRFAPEAKAELANIAAELDALQHSPRQPELDAQLSQLSASRDDAISALKQRHKEARAERKRIRHSLNPATENYQQEMARLALASQHHKREATNLTLYWQQQLEPVQLQLQVLRQQMIDLKAMHGEKLRCLHERVYATYQLQNFLGEKAAMSRLFADGLPAAGTGDCAAPKLIHYACTHQMQPIAMAEFWWGASPATGIRNHRQFYPACRGKCHPILPFMLRGLNVEDEPLYAEDISADEPITLYEDEYLLVVNKPAGLLSVPGKRVKDSVFTRLRQRYHELDELKLVHRLDMGTSGLLLVAKNHAINARLQRQFIQRSVEKRYEALLSKALDESMREGVIDLPMRIDFDDRPRQMICFEYGKPALTRWQVIDRNREQTRIWFYPETGRTHQLRVHAAHKDGLNAAIIGDGLYGDADKRLMLHAQRLCFTHPVSRERLCFEAPTPF